MQIIAKQRLQKNIKVIHYTTIIIEGLKKQIGTA